MQRQLSIILFPSTPLLANKSLLGYPPDHKKTPFNMQYFKFILLSTLAAAPTVLSQKQCIHFAGTGHSGLSTTMSWTVDIAGTKVCDTGVKSQLKAEVDCGDGGTLSYNWGPVEGPVPVTYCDPLGIW